jgi:hypothetical protein
MEKTIYRDCLGQPNSQARISVFGNYYGNPNKPYFALSTVSDMPRRKWDYTDDDVSHIVADMEAGGWECEVTKDNSNCPVINCTHTATQAVIDEAKKANDAKFANAERGYIRFGAVPKDGRSINHRDKTPEAGVSVFEAEFTTDNDYRVLVTPILEVTYVSVVNRPAYRVYGEVVGVGADGEPVLKVSRSIKL